MKKYVFLFLIIIIYILTNNFTKIEKEKKINKTKEEILVNLYEKEEMATLYLEDYVLGVVACEMPATFNKEALKAMAVAARTFALSRNNNSVIEMSLNDQCFNNESEMRKKWNEDYEKHYQNIKNAIYETEGEYIAYNNTPIKSFYFSTSNGHTESVENVFSEKLDYLVSTPSPWDIDANTYLKEEIISLQDFIKTFNVEKLININIISRYDTNRVEKIQVNNIVYSGTEFRKLLKLRSTDFDITYDVENITVITRGYGHGVGMSQYGANGMANEGYNYKEILNHYYKNTEILNV